jgi:predicted small lipoprotein YifL
MRRLMTILALLTLASCGREAAVPTSEENAQMEEAANLLDQAPDELDAIDDGELNAADANRLR